jgi:hypothetical protein
MREYVEAKVSEFSGKLASARGVLADLSRQGNHPILIEALYEVCGAIDELLRGARRLLPFNILPALRTQQAKFTQIRNHIELLEEWYLPALMNEGPEERAVSHLIDRLLHHLGVSWLADKVVSFTRGHSIFAEIGDCAIFYMQRSTRENLPDWLPVYHEIGHAVYQQFPEIGSHLKDAVCEYCQDEKAHPAWFTDPQTDWQLDRYQQTLRYWDDLRLQELFCDVFATVVAGPAYLFSWVDASVTSPLGPYQVLLHDEHPPNAARTQACVLALNEGFANAPLKMASTAMWKKFLDGHKKQPIFIQMCAHPLIQVVVRAAQEEIEKHGFPAYTKPQLSPPETLAFERIDDPQELVNVAMVNFAFAPQEFPAWQEKIAQRLYAGF